MACYDRLTVAVSTSDRTSPPRLAEHEQKQPPSKSRAFGEHHRPCEGACLFRFGRPFRHAFVARRHGKQSRLLVCFGKESLRCSNQTSLDLAIRAPKDVRQNPRSPPPTHHSWIHSASVSFSPGCGRHQRDGFPDSSSLDLRNARTKTGLGVVGRFSSYGMLDRGSASCDALYGVAVGREVVQLRADFNRILVEPGNSSRSNCANSKFG